MPEMPTILDAFVDVVKHPERGDELLNELENTETTMKKPVIIKVLCGIGDSDDFPAFDEDAEAYAAKKDLKWGFRITGGAEFHMPLTVFQVSDDSLASRAGIRLGDVILFINETDATNLTLAQAHEIINATELDLNLVVRSMDEEEPANEEPKCEAKEITLHIPVLEPPEPPKEFQPTPLLDRRFWHPIMCENAPIKKQEDEEEELPHHRIIRNIRRFFKETADRPELRTKHIEDMLLALPGAPKESEA